MINRFIRYWNQNRKKILITILIVTFAILLIKTINYILGQQTPEITNSVNTLIEDSSIPTESVITGQTLHTETTNINMDIIKKFINFCNSGNYEDAYGLLSNACKEEVFRTVDEFKLNYYDEIFDTEKTYELELWYSNSGDYTYRIIYYENNILSTGQINSSENVEDYITVVREDGNIKVNINGFISKEVINESVTRPEVEINVNERLSYRSYEIYSVTVKNNTDKDIKISDENNSNDICLVDNNQTEYDSVINEIPTIDLHINPYSSKTINIKFNKMYGEYRKIEQMLFKNIMLNIDENGTGNTSKIDLSIRI